MNALALLARVNGETGQDRAARRRKEAVDGILAIGRAGVTPEDVEFAYDSGITGCNAVSLEGASEMLARYRMGVPAPEQKEEDHGQG